MTHLILHQGDVSPLEGLHQLCVIGTNVAFLSYSLYLLRQITVGRDTALSNHQFKPLCSICLISCFMYQSVIWAFSDCTFCFSASISVRGRKKKITQSNSLQKTSITL